MLDLRQCDGRPVMADGNLGPALARQLPQNANQDSDPYREPASRVLLALRCWFEHDSHRWAQSRVRFTNEPSPSLHLHLDAQPTLGKASQLDVTQGGYRGRLEVRLWPVD